MLRLLRMIELSGQVVGLDAVYVSFCQGVAGFRTEHPYSWDVPSEPRPDFEFTTIRAAGPEVTHVLHLL